MKVWSKCVFIAIQNWETASWLEERPIRYKSAMACIELPVANLEIATATLTWTGMAIRSRVSYLCKSGARVLHKFSNVERSILIRPLNSRALNEPKRFWSKKPGRNKPLSWAHSRLWPLPFITLNPCIAKVMYHIFCKYHNIIASASLAIQSTVMYNDNWKRKKIKSFLSSGSIFRVCGTRMWKADDTESSWELTADGTEEKKSLCWRAPDSVSAGASPGAAEIGSCREGREGSHQLPLVWQRLRQEAEVATLG